MLVNLLRKNVYLRKIFYKIGRVRANRMTVRIEHLLNHSDRILDIGSGTCNICEVLLQKQYKITPLDVRDLSFVESIKPILYGGLKMPFNGNSFDVALLLTVLHHTKYPEAIIKEAMRVSKKIIIMEDIYSNKFHKFLTCLFDSLINFEFFGHPHSNRNDREWKTTLEKLGLKLICVKYSYSLLFLKHATYYAER